jgi:hypothetical protein
VHYLDENESISATRDAVIEETSDVVVDDLTVSHRTPTKVYKLTAPKLHATPPPP